ncbi:7819_t:CDS:2 [Dentiscutata erythropus]|uniref:7819_t:CDS:1 n=1 Tax=Dentiscutata erythropus TaxID=1348616 RepID=A0A9N9GDG6_9GLOM|nr:7819_t:CDS:2 [Dentiscutata erythropus]
MSSDSVNELRFEKCIVCKKPKTGDNWYILDIGHLAEGGYGSVYKAKWTHGPIEYYDNDVQEWHRSGETNIVLKSIKSSSNNNIPDEFFEEIKSQMTSFVDFGYTISDNPNDRPTAIELVDKFFGYRQKGHEIWSQINPIDKKLDSYIPPIDKPLENILYTSKLINSVSKRISMPPISSDI